MTRNGGGAVARKERGEERNKAKWMKEAQNSRKRAEKAELELAQLREQLAVTSNSEQIFITSPSSHPSDLVNENVNVVSRAEFDELRLELDELRESHDQLVMLHKSTHDERAKFQVDLELAKENVQRLQIDLNKSRAAEGIARALYKNSVEKVKQLEQVAADAAVVVEKEKKSEPETIPSDLVTTPRVPIVRDLPIASKSISPITPEQLDFNEVSSERQTYRTSPVAVTSRKVKSIWQSIVDFFSGLFLRLFGHTVTTSERTPLIV